MPSFSAQVSGWVREVKGGAEGVFKESVLALMHEAQTPRAQGGRMRIDTGFLWNSLMGSTASMPQINPNARPVKGQTYTFTGAEIEAILAGAELGNTFYLGYTAAYAAHREFGAQGQPPDAFVRTAAQKWPQIVARVERQLMARLGR